MGLPRVLKAMNLFQDGGSWIGLAKTVTLPKFTRKLEEFRGGGMDTPVKLDMGGEAMECEFEMSGPVRDMLTAFGGTLAGVQLRFTGAYQQDDTGEVATIDVIMRGRYEEIDLGGQTIGEVGSHKGKLSLSYCRIDWDGQPMIEVDAINGIMRVNGVDVLAEIRAAVS
jgi:P2 family phage contractile tail tube protein